MYYYNNHEMVYLFSGSYPEHSMFMGTNFTTWEMIKKAKEMGLPRFNFFGLTGDFTENSRDYGVYKFKKGYNTFIEFVDTVVSGVFGEITRESEEVDRKSTRLNSSHVASSHA